MASLETRANDWRVVWRQDGKKQFERFPTLEGAEEFKGKVEAYGNRWPYGWVPGYGETLAPSMAPTFREWAAQCIGSRSTANERTRHDYERDVNLHLNPTFGDVPIDRIDSPMVGRWLIDIGKQRSPKTVKNVHSLASSIMAEAIAVQKVGVNPFKGRMRGLATVKQEEMVFLTRGEFDTLLRHITPHFQPLVRFLAFTGLRWSEATALQVADVDLLERRIRVVRAWKRLPDSTFVLGEPKTRRSRRTIVIPQWLALDLTELVAGRGAREFVFTTSLGHVVQNGNFRYRAWIDAVKAIQRCTEHATDEEPCGCPGTIAKAPRIHDLRHSHASWLIADKVSLPAIQRRLGHESIQTTIDRYGHLLPDIDDEVSGVLEKWQPQPSPAPALA